MIKLLLRNTGEAFDLPQNIKISIELSSPMINDSGSLSLPITLPLTDNNRRILDHPLMLTKVPFMQEDRDVILIAHGMQKVGTLKIIAGDTASGISVVVLFAESTIYNKIGDIDMETLLGNIHIDVVSIPNYNPSEEHVFNWLDYFESIMAGEYQSPYFEVFPIQCFSENKDVIEMTVLNRQSSTSSNTSSNILDNVEDKPIGVDYYRLAAREPQQVEVEGYQVSLPIGYNVTPFFRLGPALKYIFQLLGFDLNDNNFFETNDDGKKTVVLNNTCDCLLSDKIYFAHLMPNCKVSDFIASVRNRYGCEFIFNNATMKIDIVFWRDILNRTIHPINMTDKIVGPISITYGSPETIRLSCKREMYTGDTPSFTTFQEFIAQHGEPKYRFFGSPSSGPGLYFYTDFCRYFNQHDNSFWSGSPLGFNLFDFYKGDLPAKELKCEYMETLDMVAPQNNPLYFTFFHFPTIRGPRAKVSYIKLGDSGKEYNGKESDCSITFAYRKGRSLNMHSVEGKNFYGSTYCYNNVGRMWGALNMVYGGEGGIYDNFYREYDQALRDGFSPIKCKMDLNVIDIQNYNFYHIVLIDGMRCLPSKLKYEITNETVTVVEVDFNMV